MIWVHFSSLLIFLALGHSIAEPSSSDFAIVAERNVDLSSQIVKVTTKYELTNKAKSALNSFIHLVTDEEQAHIAYISATEEKKNAKLSISKVMLKGLKKGFVAYKVEMLESVGSSSKASVTVEYHLSEYLEPYPAKINQPDPQYMIFRGNAHIASFYTVEKESSRIVLPQGRLISHTTVMPSKHDGNKITYGPYTDQRPYTMADIKVHNENNSPFLVATEMLRSIEVSHWGNIAVEEHISIVHKGAELKGSFSRLDFQLDRRGSRRPVVTQYKTMLPITAKDIYYRDEIGNISTSSVRKLSDAIELTIQPRFPLFGGWRTNYILGYNLPGYQYLYSSGNEFALKMRLVDHLFDNAVIEHLKVNIILPEGSKNFKLTTPYPVKRGKDELHFTYLDTTGRPVIVLEKDNLVDAHIQPFVLHYEFDRIQIWREPLLACVAFSILFLLVIIFVRLDFTIVTDSAKESRLQAQSHIEQLGELHVERLKLYDSAYDVIQKYKANKDTALYTRSKKKAENDLKAVTQEIVDTQNALKFTNPDIYEKLNDVARYHKTAADLINTFFLQVERVIKGNMSNSDFISAEKQFNNKIGDVKEKMDNIIYSL
uniref:Dolichyl-diphosphooligosaccharide--protein glycosyltransferase subunit 1 n=1 Tax=Syphacia muris TaxID=451379 RepID=A0A158R5U6_9BILA